MGDGTRRTVVVTGGSRGLGLAMARTLVHSGFPVVAVARSQGEELAQAMAESGGALRFQAYDLADTAGFGALARRLRAEHGPCWGLVNNAGIGTAGVLATMPDTAIAQLIHLNVTSPITLTKYLLRPMLSAGSGRVVNISSIVANTGFSGLAAYAASKAALVGFTRSLAREVGPAGVTVNALAPGFVETELTGDLTGGQRDQIKRRSALRRLATAQDVAAAVAFLLGDAAANITGTVMTVDAGGTA